MDSEDHEIHELVKQFEFKLSQTIHERDNRIHQENFQLKVQLQEQSRHIEKLEATLQEYQTRAFDSIPIDELSDVTIAEQYSIIREHISNWVECLPDVLESERNFNQAMSEFNHLFNDSILEHWPDEFRAGLSVAQTELFGTAVFRGLYNVVFDPYIMGATRGHYTLFSQLEQIMASLQVKTDVIASWRTNTIKAYTSRPRYSDAVRNLCTQFSSDLRRFFSRFTFDGHLKLGKMFHSFQEQIMNPALDLAQGMNLSSQTYHWEWYRDFNRESPGFIYKKHFRRFIVYDVRTHNRVATTNDVSSQAADEKPIARYMFTIYPALYRCTNGQYVLIEKATVLAMVLRD